MIFIVKTERIWNDNEVIDIIPNCSNTDGIRDLYDACQWFVEEGNRYTKYHLDEILGDVYCNYNICVSHIFNMRQAIKNKTYDAYCIGTIRYRIDNEKYENGIGVEVSYYYK